MAKKEKLNKKQRKQRAVDHEMQVGHGGAQPDAPAALKKYRDRMVDDEYETRRNGAKPKYGPGFKKGGRVKCPPAGKGQI